ncbi:hypothetical protein F5878DRAFT_666709 [Lentinula raphanica]|uniref:Uncharacterized protein n=1 Tax=Lentinula raphanica TaxID=153919 RepID=A0AA38UAZ7_9AGAR|nr:hypothetical protein F5878DRAFT_666709 [Lentinula raphanica]
MVRLRTTITILSAFGTAFVLAVPLYSGTSSSPPLQPTQTVQRSAGTPVTSGPAFPSPSVPSSPQARKNYYSNPAASSSSISVHMLSQGLQLPSGLAFRLDTLRPQILSGSGDKDRIIFNSVVGVYEHAASSVPRDSWGLHPDRCTEDFLDQMRNLEALLQLKLLYSVIFGPSLTHKDDWDHLMRNLQNEKEVGLRFLDNDSLGKLDKIFEATWVNSIEIRKNYGNYDWIHY